VSYGHKGLACCRPHLPPRNADFRGLTPVFSPCVSGRHGEIFSHTLLSTLGVTRHSFDIVQFHALGPAPFFGLPRPRGLCTATSICGLDWQREKWGTVARRILEFCESISYRLPDATHVVSRTLQQCNRERCGVEVTNIPNGVNLETVPPHKEIHALGFQGANYFLFMGGISPEKGCKEMIEAFRSLGSRPTKLVVTERQRKPLTTRTRAAQCRQRGVRGQLLSCHQPGIDVRPRFPLRQERQCSSLGKYCLPELPTQQGCSGPGGGPKPDGRDAAQVPRHQVGIGSELSSGSVRASPSV